ncbi:hypothetical protein [Shimazuella alba]|uniref:Uncharacterized protein n=1 Tax=Shimazuella alba TaxID=2690964 RepID=A0A6I4VYH3_9BACL|nr:hypothetical protein [Shimazuella alba]MXQ54980.1 hypothetical protein [Shimazuella alba]
MLNYQFDTNTIHLEESPNNEEIEIQIKLLQPEPYAKYLKQVKDFFDGNDRYTEVLFYYCKNNEYRIIVKPDYYNDLILMLMRHQLLQKVEWKH